MRILFIGDIVGKIGRKIVKEKIDYYCNKYSIDFVIANGENATHGKGLIRHHYDELVNSGVDVITLGNHYKNKSELVKYIDRVDNIVRPANLIHNFPGEGSILFDVDGVRVRITNLLGVAFMDEEVNSPYLTLLNILSEDDSDIHIVDYHAEATGEKQGFGYAFDGQVSAILGTHTHVQTNDAHILENGTGYISDVGMCGFSQGILGFEKNSVMKKTLFGQMSKFDLPAEGPALFNAVVLDIDEITGKCIEIFTINYRE